MATPFFSAVAKKPKLLLCDEKDRILAKYGLIHCSKEQLTSLPTSAILHQKENPFGVEVMVLRDLVPDSFAILPISMEEIFICLVKEAV